MKIYYYQKLKTIDAISDPVMVASFESNIDKIIQDLKSAEIGDKITVEILDSNHDDLQVCQELGIL